METIEDRGFSLEIAEYGKRVRQYHDTDYDRFMETAIKTIDSHLRHNSRQIGEKSESEVKNISIRIYTI